MIPTVPLRPRNRLAHLILVSLGDVDSRAEIARLASDPHVADEWLDPADRERYASVLRARAQRATAALADRAPMPPDASLDTEVGDVLAEPAAPVDAEVEAIDAEVDATDAADEELSS